MGFGIRFMKLGSKVKKCTEINIDSMEEIIDDVPVIRVAEDFKVYTNRGEQIIIVPESVKPHPHWVQMSDS